MVEYNAVFITKVSDCYVISLSTKGDVFYNAIR